MKSKLVSHRTFQLVLHLSSSIEPDYECGYLQNTPAFQALLCDLDVSIQILAECLFRMLIRNYILMLSLFSGVAEHCRRSAPLSSEVLC